PRRTPRPLGLLLRGAAERVRDRGEDVVHRSASRTHRTDRDQRDQRDEQRVLEQVLSLFVAKRLHDGNKLRHLIPPGNAPPWAVRWCGMRPRPFCMRGDLAAPRPGLIATAVPRLRLHTTECRASCSADGDSSGGQWPRRAARAKLPHTPPAVTFVSGVLKFVTRSRSDRLKMIACRRVSACFCTHSAGIEGVSVAAHQLPQYRNGRTGQVARRLAIRERTRGDETRIS